MDHHGLGKTALPDLNRSADMNNGNGLGGPIKREE